VACVPGGRLALNNPTLRFDGEVLVKVFKVAEEMSGDDAIGFKCGLNHAHAVYNDIAYTIMYCQNLQESFDISVRYESLVQTFGINSLVIDGDEAYLCWRTHDDAPEHLRHVSDLSFATVARLVLWIKTIHGLTIKRMDVRHQNRSYEKLYMDMFNAPLHYGAEFDMFTFDKAFLEFPLPGRNPKILGLLTSRLEKDLQSLEKPLTESNKVTAYIDKILGETHPTIAHVSSLMGLTERTLRRRLATEETSFRSLLENVRRERYNLLLEQGEHSQSQIAGLLGYSEQSAFSRAYKKWHGKPPSKSQRQ